MASNVTLQLDHDQLEAETIFLEATGYDNAGQEDFESYEHDIPWLMIGMHSYTGAVLSVELDRFKALSEAVIMELRENPLPWTFSLPELGIKEKPLEDVLLAVWKKYKSIKMEWE